MTALLQLRLEFARLEQTERPFAEVFGTQDYLVRLDGGGYRQVQLSWQSGFKQLLERVRLPERDPADVAALGEALRDFLAGADWEVTDRSRMRPAWRQRRGVRAG